MHQDFLSEIELYYCPQTDRESNSIILSEDEAHHAANVMRHKEGEILFVTDGLGHIYKTEINSVKKNKVAAEIIETTEYINEFRNIYFCIPRLKSKDRFEFAIEKCVELGITKFIIFESDRTISKGDKSDKWIKLGISAMKQSLRPFLPEFGFASGVDEILKNCSKEGSDVFWFEQKAEEIFSSQKDKIKESGKNSYFIFGPEGGLSEREFEQLKDKQSLKLTGNRLRSETAVISAAVQLTI